MWMDEAPGQTEQPVGLAAPVAPPLGVYASPPPAAPDTAAEAPAQYAPPSTPGPRLDQIAPAVAISRDPRQPFTAGLGDQLRGQRDHDPRQPLMVTSFGPATTGGTFAPPTGAPVVPTGPPGTPTGRPRTHPGAPGTPAGYPQTHPGAPGRLAPATPGTGRVTPKPAHSRPLTDEDRARARYHQAEDGLGKFGVVLWAVPWPALLVLLAGAVVGSAASFWAIWVVMLICGSAAKVAKQAMMRVLFVAIVAMLVTGGVACVAGSFVNVDSAAAEYLVARWCCGLLTVGLPIMAWQGLRQP